MTKLRRVSHVQIAIRQGTTPRGDGAKPSVAESITKREERESTREPDGELIKAENKKMGG